MKEEAVRMLWMVPAGWLNHLPGAAGWAIETLPEGHLMDGMN